MSDNPIIDTVRTPIFTNKANDLWLKAEYDSSFYYYNKLSAIYKQTEDWQKYIRCLIYISEYYNIKGEIDKADENINNALRIAEINLHKGHILFSELYRTMSSLFFINGNYEESIKFINKSLAIRNKIIKSNDTSLSYHYNILGVNYYSLGKYNEAMDYYNKALNICLVKKIKPFREIGSIYSNLGMIYRLKGDFDKAISYYNNAKSIFSEAFGNDVI
ncbi:MAG: tetratricopeptide repeat protein [Bacteroidales bacterium]|nr:tetratricopeptide repeat protein [Bacteroidales bacterium]